MTIRKFLMLGALSHMAHRWWVRRPRISLANKVAIVTGASSGIGLATAKAFAHEGCHVVLVARREHLLNEIKQEIDFQAKHPVLVVAGDVSKDADLQNIVTQTMQAYGRIDIVVNNAGISPVGPYEKLSEDDIRQTIEINLYAAMRLTHLVVPIMKAQKSGHILNVTSTAEFARSIGHAAYVASKAGLSGFSESILREFHPHGIHVTVIMPGWTYTPLLSTEGEEVIRQKLIDADLFSIGMTLDSAETVANKIVESVERRYYRVILGGWMFYVIDLGERISPRLIDLSFALFSRNPQKSMQFLYEETHKTSQE